jgi:hypothetical protein
MVFDRFDIFPKFRDRSIRLRTVSGGVISLGMIVWVSFLFFGQLVDALTSRVDSSIVADTDPISGPRKVFLEFNIMINSPCTILHFDLFDADGSIKTDIIESLNRTRFVESGLTLEQHMERHFQQVIKPQKRKKQKDICLSCYGALPADSCCNTCHSVMEAMRKRGWSFYGADRWAQCQTEGYFGFGREKCRLNGSVKVKRGAGHFHMGLGANYLGSVKGHQHDLGSVTKNHSLSHKVAWFHIGRPLPDFAPPLDDIEIVLDEAAKGLWLVTYYLHIVPAKHFFARGVTESYRYSAMYSQKVITNSSAKGLPGIHVYYDFSPMMVVSRPKVASLRHLVTHLAGLIGGAFSFAAILDAFMFGALSTLEGKRNIGKDV